jgi:hypothetical protein
MAWLVGSRRSALTATLVPTGVQAKIVGTKVHDQAEEIAMYDMRGGIAVPSTYSDSADVIRCESRHCSVPWRKESEETRAKSPALVRSENSKDSVARLTFTHCRVFPDVQHATAACFADTHEMITMTAVSQTEHALDFLAFADAIMRVRFLQATVSFCLTGRELRRFSLRRAKCPKLCSCDFLVADINFSRC